MIGRLARKGFVPKWAIVSQAVFLLKEAKADHSGGPRRKARGGK